MGYDSHLSPAGPRLIEINTNAGGALLNMALARAQHACCDSMNWAFTPNTELPKLEQTFCDRFAAEWRRQRGTGAVALTPHPRAHALYADKRNLIAMSDEALLRAWGVSDNDRGLLKAAIPQTRGVTPERADELWAQRRQLFFKPATGFGARAAYRGDKLTRRVWGEIVAGDFVAQTLVAPEERLIEVDGMRTGLKFDVRAYSYEGKVQLLAARIYAGQTTNFHTPGGGFAPVVVAPG